MDAAADPLGTFPALWQIRQAARGVGRNRSATSGCSVTSRTVVRGPCGG